MDSQCLIRMDRYLVNQIDFHLNPDFDFKTPQKRLDINPRFERQVKKISENSLLVELSISIHDNDTPAPFHLDIEISGMFQCENWNAKPEDEKLVIDSTTAILFPYLRSLVTMVTANANIPPMIIPVMNVSALFQKDSQK